MRFLVLALGVAASTALANDNTWQTSWDGTVYGYATARDLRADSVLNPGNRVARLVERSELAELRLNLKAENEDLRLTARPIVYTREQHNAFGTQRGSDGYFSQWQLRMRIGEGWNLAAGREVLNWGPAQFRSPSSPFYFDNGRSDPMRELVGMDALKISWTPDMRSSASLVRIVGSGHGSVKPGIWRDGWLAGFDRRGDSWALGLILAKAPDQPAFYGTHGQATVSDALMLYGEIGSSARPVALQSPSDETQPFAVQAPSSRRTTSLIGANHSFEDGNSFAVEYLHEGGGYSAAEEQAYFRRATGVPGIALGLAPRLLGRDYVHAIWQSNLLDEKGYWRLMYTRNLTDRGNEIAAYGEVVLTRRLGAYLLAVLPQGNARQEFSALFQRSLTLGLKIALP